MDIDKPLDDLISDKRKARPQPERRGTGPRQSGGRAAAVPYARPPPRSTEDKWVHDAFQGSGAGRRVPFNGNAGGNIAAVGGTGVGFTGISPRIEVIGLHYEVTPADLKGIFSQAASTWNRSQYPRNHIYVSREVLMLCLSFPGVSHHQYDRSGRSKGEAVMEFANYQQAKIAINKFDGAMTKGQTISIRLLPPFVPRAAPVLAPPVQTGGSLLSRIAGSGNGVAGVARGGRGGQGGAVRGRGGPVRGFAGRGGAGGARGGRKGPVSVGDLDKELDGFMTTSTVGGGDVDMA